MKMKELSRRNFLFGATAAAGALVLGGCTSTGAGEGTKDELVWDEETDVVVIGFGGSGGSAAIAASDAGANVLILEKANEADAGGNTSVCGGGGAFCSPDKKEECFNFLRYQMPDTITDEEIRGFVEELSTEEEWLREHGAETTVTTGVDGIQYPMLENAEGLDRTVFMGGTGASFYRQLSTMAIESPGVTAYYETPAKRLIVNRDTNEIIGVVATKPDGTDINIKAKRGVCMTLGGFENDHEMMTSFYPPMTPIFPAGTPYNTGDGIRMLTGVNAKLRGFSSAEYALHCCKPASEEVGVAVGMAWSDPAVWEGCIVVNDKGKRFMPEASLVCNVGDVKVMRPLHDKSQLPEWRFDMKELRYINLPMFLVCDESRRAAMPLFNAASKSAGNHWSNVKGWYTWSEDNMAEVDKGWLVKADTLEELAQKIGVDAEGLAATVAKYNEAVATGVDTEWGRELSMTTGILQPPFYATELGLGLLNTQGGPARDAEHHVLDWDDQPVPRLYAGGEFGSMYTWMYQGAGNISECLASRTAGANAAAETPWDE